jgi:hypothetical protein
MRNIGKDVGFCLDIYTKLSGCACAKDSSGVHKS